MWILHGLPFKVCIAFSSGHEWIPCLLTFRKWHREGWVGSCTGVRAWGQVFLIKNSPWACGVASVAFLGMTFYFERTFLEGLIFSSRFCSGSAYALIFTLATCLSSTSWGWLCPHNHSPQLCFREIKLEMSGLKQRVCQRCVFLSLTWERKPTCARLAHF